MSHKFFPYDKNYILQRAQEDTKQLLLNFLIEHVKTSYYILYNPLRLEDNISLKIDQTNNYDINMLHGFYDYLAGIYRFKFGETQLEFLFDGKTHYEKYCEDWKIQFKSWIDQFCLNHNFIKAVLEIAIFHSTSKNTHVTNIRMKSFLSRFFEVKTHKRKGTPMLKLKTA